MQPRFLAGAGRGHGMAASVRWERLASTA